MHKKKIGLLGGSFNPAHDGHVRITLTALKRFDLHEVWWLVSPGNPLKEKAPEPMQQRMQSALQLITHPRVIVSNIEERIGSTFTTDTLTSLNKLYPQHTFVWLMGADNLRQIPKWRGWQRIFRMVPIAIFPRPSYSRRALAGKASRRFKRFQIKTARAPRLATMRAPAWVFLRTQPNATSATRIRAQLARERPQ